MRLGFISIGFATISAAACLLSPLAVAGTPEHFSGIHGYGCPTFGPCKGYYDDHGNRWNGADGWNRAARGGAPDSRGHDGHNGHGGWHGHR